MSIFSKLKDRIFGKKEEAPAAEEAVAEEAAAEEGAATEDAPTPSPAVEAAPEAPAEPVDVAAILTEMEANHPEDLDWKRSIVDLMKLVGMDSSYGDRKELALELGYSQADIDSKGSAEMNMWLHKEVMKKLAENGGTVPAELLD
jgi:3-oxoacyl-ACP reductase-like protein